MGRRKKGKIISLESRDKSTRFYENKDHKSQQGVFLDHSPCSSMPPVCPRPTLCAPLYLAESDFTLCGKQCSNDPPLFNSPFLPRQFYLAFETKRSVKIQDMRERGAETDD